MNTIISIEEATVLKNWYNDIPFEVLNSFKNDKNETILLIKSESSIEVIVIYEQGMHLLEDMRFIVPESKKATEVIESFAVQLFNTLIKHSK